MSDADKAKFPALWEAFVGFAKRNDDMAALNLLVSASSLCDMPHILHLGNLNGSRSARVRLWLASNIVRGLGYNRPELFCVPDPCLRGLLAKFASNLRDRAVLLAIKDRLIELGLLDA